MWTPEHIATSREQAVHAFHEYERRQHPLQLWKKLCRKVRFYHIDFCPGLGEQEIGVILSNERFLYPATSKGIKEAIVDIEHAFVNDIL